MMLCDADQFSHEMKKLDIRRGDQIVFYDTNMMVGVCRAYWIFRVFGLKPLIMDGPIQKWMSEGLPTEFGPPSTKDKREAPESDEVYAFQKNDDLVFDY